MRAPRLRKKSKMGGFAVIRFCHRSASARAHLRATDERLARMGLSAHPAAIYTGTGVVREYRESRGGSFQGSPRMFAAGTIG
jgi:hypothetical protein